MKHKIRKNIQIIVALAALLVIGTVIMAFQNTTFGPIDKLDTLTELADTIPEKSKDAELKMSMKDFDQLLLQLDNESVQIKPTITGDDLKKIQNEITNSLSKVEFDKIKMSIDKALKEIDFAKIEKNVQSALNTIEWNKINNDAKNSLEDVKKEIDKIKMTEIKKEMEKAKFEIEKSKEEIKKINMSEIMKHACESVASAKASLYLKKEMFDKMEQEGLINKKDGFTIEFKDKTLFINGKKQPDSISQQYRHYFNGDSFKISISKE
jgi:hypothetical protein